MQIHRGVGVLGLLVARIDCVQNFVKFFKQILSKALDAEKKKQTFNRKANIHKVEHSISDSAIDSWRDICSFSLFFFAKNWAIR